MKSTKKNLGNYLKKMRERSELTQKEVAEHLKYSSAQFVSNWERGASMPPLKALSKLIKFCNMDVDVVVDIIIEQSRVRLCKELGCQRKTTPKSQGLSQCHSGHALV